MALSDDLRKRVVEAVVLGGLSRNGAARRFGVSIASAVRRVRRYKTTGAYFAFAFRGRSPVRADRGAARLFARLDPTHAGSHAARDPRAPDPKLRRALLGFRALALLRPPRRHF